MIQKPIDSAVGVIEKQSKHCKMKEEIKLAYEVLRNFEENMRRKDFFDPKLRHNLVQD